MFEMIVVIAVVLLLVRAIVPTFINSYITGGNQTIDDARDIVNLLQTGRQYAIANKNDDYWGIHVVDNGTSDCNSTTTVDCVVLYKGKVFASRDSSYDTIVTLRANNYLTSLDGTDFYFQRYSGYLMDTYAFPPSPQAHYTFSNYSNRFYGYIGDYFLDKVFDISGNANDAVATDLFDGNPCGTNYYTLSRGTPALYCQASEGLALPSTLLGHQNSTGLTYALEFSPNIFSDSALIGGSPSNADAHFKSGGLWIDSTLVPKATCYDGSSYQTAQLDHSLVNTDTHHLAMTYDPSVGSNNLKLYVDGDLAAQTTCSSITEGMSYAYIGLNPDATMSYQGVMDEVFVYNRPLSATEIHQLSIYSSPTTTDAVIDSKLYVANGVNTTTVELNGSGMAWYY